ncbi:MAG TPA: C-type lectin domain-containing protein [Kofleriaceae bacterium]|nr:C-type lectin domain-containing protein [Kofleriaceae bacterium]
MRALRPASLWIALALGACFSPTFNNPTCGPNGECPSGTTCVQDVCRSDGADIDAPIDTPPIDPDAMVDSAIDAPTDAASDGAPPIDGPPIDAPVDAPPPTCPNGHIPSPTNPSRCFSRVNTAASWSSARSFCQALTGGDLADVLNVQENAAIQPLYQGESNGVWIGLTDQTSESAFIWINTNAPVGFAAWASGEPNNQPGTNADCVRIEGGTGQWLDDVCGDSKRAICVFTIQ